MRRPLILLPLLMAACADTREREAEALGASVASTRANLAALGQAPDGPRPAPAAPAPRDGAPRSTSQLMGAAPARLLATLGEPTLRREEGGASVWLYAAGGCHLDIVLYPTPSGPRVAHVQARAGGIAQRSEASCLRDLTAQRRTPPPSAAPVELGA